MRWVVAHKNLIQSRNGTKFYKNVTHVQKLVLNLNEVLIPFAIPNSSLFLGHETKSTRKSTTRTYYISKDFYMFVSIVRNSFYFLYSKTLSFHWLIVTFS